jgi:hypothetical protein
MQKSRYQLYILDEVDGHFVAKHLGPCKSEAQATTMFNNAYAEKQLNNPKQVLLVPSSNIFLCKPIQLFQLEAIIQEEPGITPAPETPSEPQT